MELTEEFSDAIASGSEFQLRSAQQKWHSACDWVEKGSQIIHAITHDERDAPPIVQRRQLAARRVIAEYAGHVLARTESDRTSARASGAIRLVHHRYQNLAAAKDDLASLADDALSHPVTPLFITPSEMIDVAESELLSHRVSAVSGALPAGENAVALAGDDSDALHELDHWLGMLQGIEPERTTATGGRLADTGEFCGGVLPRFHAAADRRSE
jgi:hypothetical protein